MTDSFDRLPEESFSSVMPIPQARAPPPACTTRSSIGITAVSAEWTLCRYRHKAHLLRDLKGRYGSEPPQGDWAADRATLLSEAHAASPPARQPGQPALDAPILDDLLTRY